MATRRRSTSAASFNKRLAQVTATNGRGRPASAPTRPHAAKQAVTAWRQANKQLAEANTARDRAFRLMVEAGMVGSQISKATGMPRASVAWQAEQMDLELVRAKRPKPRNARVAIERVRKPGSILFG